MARLVEASSWPPGLVSLQYLISIKWIWRTKKRKEIPQAVKALTTSIKEKRIPRVKAPCISSTKRTKKSMGPGGILAVARA
eukprot:1143980-Pelagomonas_calceolata.AAC.1